jgi:hypothetical protein
MQRGKILALDVATKTGVAEGRPGEVPRLETIDLKRVRSVVVGEKFSRLTAVQFVRYNRRGEVWLFACDCGKQREMAEFDVKYGYVKSCGCLRVERSRQIHVTHGYRKNGERSVEYNCWHNMIQRCTNKNRKGWKDYGGRGISVCDRWRLGDGSRTAFECFLGDMGRRPSPLHSIDRYPKNEGNYEPGNVRWATASQQAFNRRPKAKKAEQSA